MKLRKIVLISLVMCGMCAGLSAQISFSAWGRAVITPLAFMGDHSAVSAATSTWGDVPSIGFSANGKAPSGNIGFNIDFDFGVNVANSAPAIIGDNAKVWVKPLGGIVPERFNMLKLTAGLFKEEEFRGKIGASEFASWLVYSGSPNEDNIFQRFDALAGAHFKIEPLLWWDSPWNGVNIQGAFGSNTLGASGNKLRAIWNLLNNEDNSVLGIYNEDNVTNPGERTVSAEDVYKAMQLAVGYTIPDIGLARFQYIGNNRNVFRWAEESGTGVDRERKLVTGLQTTKNADVIEGAFLYSGVPGLTVDVGAKIPLEYTTKNDIVIYEHIVKEDGSGVYDAIDNKNNREYTIQEPLVVAAGVSWTPATENALKNLNVTARFDVSFGGSKKSADDGKEVKDGYRLDFWLMPSYTVSENRENETNKLLGYFKVGIDIGLDIHGQNTLTIKGADANQKKEIQEQMELSEYTDFGFGPWFELGVGGGRVRTGVVVMIPSSKRYAYVPSSNSNKYPPILTGDPVVSVPISITYSF